MKTRIHFTMGNKSGDSANPYMLFILFDETMVGGIKELKRKKRELLSTTHVLLFNEWGTHKRKHLKIQFFHLEERTREAKMGVI